jgi:hypothetical protein
MIRNIATLSPLYKFPKKITFTTKIEQEASFLLFQKANKLILFSDLCSI